MRLHFFTSAVRANSKMDHYIWELKAYLTVSVLDSENEILCGHSL